MVSSTNVEAVAANNVALQLCGQKVVYGHVMTNSGRRILIQITFDVMNLRKPLLSTSALNHRGVTIIFNHDYDRIIFRNETVNLVSHDCHSYLHISLTNGIQRLVPDLCCESWTMFSAQTSCGDQDGGYFAEIPDILYVHSNSGREQDSAMC